MRRYRLPHFDIIPAFISKLDGVPSAGATTSERFKFNSAKCKFTGGYID